MRIVAASKSHVPAIVDLMTASPLLRRYRVTRRGARKSLAEALRVEDIVLVALDGTELAGMAWVVPTRALGRSAYLRLLLVAEGRRSRGVGAALLERAERRAAVAGCRHLLLLVTTDNGRARAFYARHGYRHVGDLAGFVRPRISESLYRRALPRAK